MFSDLDHSLIQSRAPDFSQPLELLKACHEKIRFHLDLLIRLCEYLKTNTEDTEAYKTSRQVYRYFSSSAKLHHQDEDEDLFPVLLSKPDISAEARYLIIHLQQEHTSLNEQWQAFENILLKNNLNRLPSMLEDALLLQKNYEQHIENENRVILPEAEKLLNEHEINLLGRAMQSRRQQAPNPENG